MIAPAGHGLGKTWVVARGVELRGMRNLVVTGGVASWQGSFGDPAERVAAARPGRDFEAWLLGHPTGGPSAPILPAGVSAGQAGPLKLWHDF
jgi:hypothetical protein